jgi:hypothetical protein
MADTRDWLASWRAHYADRPGGDRSLAYRLRVTAHEQRGNYDGARPSARDPQWRKCVALLERRAIEAERAAGVRFVYHTGPQGTFWVPEPIAPKSDRARSKVS